MGSGQFDKEASQTRSDRVAKNRDVSRGSPRSFAEQKSLLRMTNRYSLVPVAAPATRREGGDAEQTQVVLHPPQTAPGLGPPRLWNETWIQLFLLDAE